MGIHLKFRWKAESVMNYKIRFTTGLRDFHARRMCPSEHLSTRGKQGLSASPAARSVLLEAYESGTAAGRLPVSLSYSIRVFLEI